MPDNPLCVPSPDPKVELPLVELKQHLLLFVDSPPGPKTARLVYDLYLRTWGDRFRSYKSTWEGDLRHDWSPAARRRFETDELPELRRYDDWGYAFSDKRPRDSWIFTFHGYRPDSQRGKASFYRFEFDWQLEAEGLLAFTQAVLEIVRCVSGYAGLLLFLYTFLI